MKKLNKLNKMCGILTHGVNNIIIIKEQCGGQALMNREEVVVSHAKIE